MLDLELVLPCYNEGKSIKTIVKRARDAALANGFSPERFQLILVENGSNDDSSMIMDELKKTELGAWFRIVRVYPNEGYGNGIGLGLKTTTAKVVSWSHADQQCDPADLFNAYHVLIQAGAKTLIKGRRFDRNWKDVIVSRIFETLAALILGVVIWDINAQPKVFPRELLTEIENPPKTFAFDLYVLFRAKKARFQIGTIPVRFPPRAHGISNWTGTFLGRYKTILGIIRYMFALARKEGRA